MSKHPTSPLIRVTTRWFLLNLCLAGILGIASFTEAWAQKTQLPPAKVQQIKKTRKNFENCRKDALSQVEQGKISKRKFETMLNTCNDSFPGASLYVSCKKQALQEAAQKNTAPNKNLKQCRRYLTAASFDSENPLPLFVEDNQVYFGGVGLNHASLMQSLNPPNFDCSKLVPSARKPQQAQYLLFGNHPRFFAGLTALSPAELTKTLQFTKPNKAGVDSPHFGRIFGLPAKPSGTVFFPSASCDFDSETGDVYGGLSTYYLLDAKINFATPYFGIAYYRQDQNKISTAKLIQATIKALGTSYSAKRKNNTTSFITASDIKETDEEKDPKNLCQKPRQHSLVGVVQGQKDNPAKPEYLVLANIKNLCDFGDELAKRLTP